MPSPAAIDAGPVAATTDTPAVVAALRGQVQDLLHTIRFNLPALHAVHDDPCRPAQRALLGDVIERLTAAVEGEQ
jgi:hypothetical protein